MRKFLVLTQLSDEGIFSREHMGLNIILPSGLSYKKVRPKLYSFDRSNGRNCRNFQPFETNFLIGETSVEIRNVSRMESLRPAISLKV